MSELPEGWAWSSLADLAELKGGITKGSKRHPGEQVRPVPYLRVANVQRGYLDLAEVTDIYASQNEVDALRLEVGDVLFNEGGDRDKLGRGWVWEGQVPLCIHQNHVFRARIRGGAILPKLLSMYGNTCGKDYFLDGGKQTTNLASLSLTKLSGLPVLVPPLAEQRRIVAKIEALTSHSRRAKEELDAIPGLLEDFRRSLLAAAFRGDLTADWRAKHPDVEPADKLLTRIRAERRRRWEEAELAKMRAKGKTPGDDRWKAKYEEPAPVDAEGLPELPEGWCWAGLEELCAGDAPIVYGIILPGDDVPDGIPYLRPVDVRDDGSVDFTSVKRTSPEIARQYERASLKAGDVILSIVGTIGKVVITPRELEGGNITQSSVRVRAAPGILTDFMRFALLSPHMRKQYDRHRFGNAVQRLNVEHVRRLIVPVPPKEEQKAIVAGVSVGLQSSPSESILDLRSQLSYLNRSILAKAFRGELVPQDPSDEPASVLLDRIRAERAQAEAAPKGEPAARKRKKP